MKKFSWPKNILLLLIAIVVGILIGGYVFRDVQPRSILAIDRCEQHCLRPNDLIGLLTSAGIQNVSGLLLEPVMETDKTVVINHPFPQAPVHYLIFPKRDIRNIGELSEEDKAYFLDAFSVISALIRRDHLRNYKLVTNGPENQITSYLHFHLIANEPENTLRNFKDALHLEYSNENDFNLEPCDLDSVGRLKEFFSEEHFRDIHYNQITNCYWLADMRFAFVTQPNANIAMSDVRKWEGDGNIASSGLLIKQIKGEWQWFFRIDKDDFNPVGLYLDLDKDRLVLDIADDSGAGSGEGRLLRYIYPFKGSDKANLYKWQRESSCEGYYVPEKYSYSDGKCSKGTRPEQPAK